MGEYLDNNKKMGPNVKRLLAEFAAMIAIPHGTKNPLGAGLEAFSSKERMIDISRQAMTQVETALAAMKAAPDNPYGDDDEVIAGAILDTLKKRRGED